MTIDRNPPQSHHAFNYPFVCRLLDVCHGQLERERQLVLFLVFEHLEEDLAGYLGRVGDRGMSPKTIQVRILVMYFFFLNTITLNFILIFFLLLFLT